jgi:hypothetical protein
VWLPSPEPRFAYDPPPESGEPNSCGARRRLGLRLRGAVSNNGSSTTSTATASPAVAKPSDGDIDAARRQTLQSFSLPPDGNFITDYEYVGEPSDLSYCWPRYITNFTFACST